MTACATCVRRSVDCDAARPRCAPCKRSHIKCSYDNCTPVFEFRDETDQVKASVRRRKRQKTEDEPDNDDTAPKPTADQVRDAESQDLGTVHHDDLLLFPEHVIMDFDLSQMPWLDDEVEGYLDTNFTSFQQDKLPFDQDGDARHTFAQEASRIPVQSPHPDNDRIRDSAVDAPSTVSVTSAGSVSDHVLAQHYTQTLASRYSSKDRGWNYYTYFYTRFSTSNSHVLSAFFAWSSAHLYCNGALNSPANAQAHHERSVASMESLYQMNISEAHIESHSALVNQEDLDAVAISLYFLASTDLLLSECRQLRDMLSFMAKLLQAHPSRARGTFFAKMLTWMCFLDARASAFGVMECKVIGGIGGETGLLDTVNSTQNLLHKEYNLLYPEKEHQRDSAHTPLLQLTNRLVALFGLVSNVFRGVPNAPNQHNVQHSLFQAQEVRTLSINKLKKASVLICTRRWKP